MFRTCLIVWFVSYSLMSVSVFELFRSDLSHQSIGIPTNISLDLNHPVKPELEPPCRT